MSSILASSLAQASQWGPVFPSHRYPTDRSFHLNSWFSYGSQTSAFDSGANRQDLDATLTRLRLIINPEYQPSRELSLGAYFNIDSLKLSGNGQQLTKSGFSDQYVFGEYRFIDEPGQSIGFATVFKIPLYSVPGEVGATTDDFLLLGDGQIDASLLLTTEYWAWRNIKLLGDIGLTYRTDEHATELPFQVGAEYVSPKYNIGVAVLGNLSFKNDKATQATTTQEIQSLTGNTNYVFATNPETIIFELKGEYAFNYSWAGMLSFQNSIWGKNSPFFVNISAGISYRFFEPSESKRSAREVGIETDDTSKDFEGELQEEAPAEDLLDDDFY
ncbi:MAG: hypothetical protein R3A80_06695 [Bdellovibrionota bacterium]